MPSDACGETRNGAGGKRRANRKTPVPLFRSVRAVVVLPLDRTASAIFQSANIRIRHPTTATFENLYSFGYLRLFVIRDCAPRTLDKTKIDKLECDQL